MMRDVILVTGGSQGIGRAIVEALVSAGQRVAFTYRTNLEAAREVEAQHRDQVRAYPMELADRQRPGTLVTEIEEGLGPIAGLVNNAGSREDALLGFTSDSSLDRLLDVNLAGTLRCCRAVLPPMIRRRAGSIVSVSSLAAYRGVAGLSVYAASKAALEGMTRSLAREVGKRGVRVNLVVPGFVSTDLTAGVSAEQVAALRRTECLATGVPAGAVADAVVFLLSSRAASITGQALFVDAGSSA
jgi:3-oxoacyl-[acyl-carrier protein] reductase